MKFFDEAMLRLKQQLGVTEDRDVAEALGMSANALTLRKRRGSFPEKEFLALVAKRPDLGLDIDYVLVGHHSQVFEAGIKDAAKNPLVTEDETMAGLFAALSHESRAEVLSVARRLRELEMLVATVRDKASKSRRSK
ncbi:TPA: helix-turn-helix domain-containing protein [Klebsiella pneumoniae]